MRLKTHDKVAPGGGGQWVFRQKETGHLMRRLIFNDLAMDVLQHRRNNKLPLVTPPFHDIVEEIDDWYCQNMSLQNKQYWCDAVTGPIQPRPGDLLASLIFRLTGQAARNCGVCGQRMRDMNEWGWIGCWKRRKTILGWLCESAAQRGHAISKAEAYSLFKAGWRELVIR